MLEVHTQLGDFFLQENQVDRRKKVGKTNLCVPDNWTFKTPAIAEAFDAHVREQLPWYELATGAVVHVARGFIPEGGVVVDVGASTGNVGRALAPVLTARGALFLPFDSSWEMAQVYDGPGHLAVTDAVEYNFAAAKPDVIVCFLSLMFVRGRDRAIVMQRMKNALTPGGAIIVVDKLEPGPGYVGTVNYRLTLAAKHEAGAKPEDIIRKELSISGVQRPLSSDELVGFYEFFRFGDFFGAVWQKPAG